MQAISTKYLGPTYTRGGRIKAYTESGHSLTIGYPHELDTREAHASAAVALCKSLGWDGTLISGGTADGYVFVFASSDHYAINTSDEERETAARIRQKRADTILARVQE